ncbi:delta-60 repeat domain-containing protein [Prosthecobacter debontii]|uniref:Delta-60 repeat domain-containing protein n=1 Tax=Prosthecobacter debontii TaxID=48467 RepID=A0A1T4WV18_9BACT|nr:autotransporter-associated beta strand repeat-containing protein [Prosthecobacter debontii]SKA80708.1 delta-60 repeat domain-containing protein [Prosthecobacter debontii]
MKTNLASLRMTSVACKAAALIVSLLGVAPVWSQSSLQKVLSQVDGSSLLNANGSWGQATSAWSQNTLITATATATRTGTGVGTITIVNPGAGYLSAPTVTISGGGGSGAVATATVSNGRVVSIVVTTAGTGYTSNPTVTIAPPSVGGVGSSVRFNNDITNNIIINLDGNRVVGRMQLGDLSSGNYYTIAQGSSGSLIFDNAGNGGGAYFNRVTGHSNDIITAPMILRDQLNVRNTTNRVTFSGNIRTTNGSMLTSYGNGTLAITGNNTSTPFDLWIWNRGTSNTGAQVELGATTGNAISGDIRIGSASQGMSGHAVLQLLRGRSNLDQISDSSTLTFESFSGSGRNNYFKLMGGNETVGNIVDLGSLAVIENREAETDVTTGAKLTLAGDENSYVSGFIRDRSGNNLQQADADGNAGATALSLRKEGSGVLSLQNSNISFSGGLEIAEGTAILRQTTNFRSDVVNNGTLIFDTGTLNTTQTWNFIKTFADPDGSGSQLAPAQRALIISGTGGVEKTGAGILNLSSSHGQNQAIGGTLTVRNGTLNLAGSGTGAVVGGALIVDGDSGLNRNVGLWGRTTINGGIDATGRFNNTGSMISIRGTVFTGGDQLTSTYEDGVATINGAVKLNYMSLSLGGGFAITKTTAGGSSSNTVTVTNSSSIVVGMRVTGAGVPSNTTVQSYNPVTRVVTLSSNVSVSGGASLTFSQTSNSDGVINGTMNSLTIIGRPNPIGSSAINNGRLILNNSQYSRNSNRIPDSAAIVLKGGAIDMINDASNNTFSETLGALTLSQGQAQIVGYQAGSGGTSSLSFASLQRNYGATVEFAGLEQTSSGGVNNVTNALGTSTRNRIMINGGVTMDDGIIGGWAWANNEFVKYGANGVTRLTSSDYLLTTGSGTNALSTWTYDKNVKLSLSGTLTLNTRRAVNSVNFQSDIAAAAASRTLTLGAGAILSIDSGGLLASHGNQTINGNGSTGYVTVGTAINKPADLVAIVGTNAGTTSANTLTLQTAIRDFELRFTSGVTMSAGSKDMTVPANTATMLQVGMEVVNPNLPVGTVITAVNRTQSGQTIITLSNAPISGSLTATSSRSVTFYGGSVGLTKSGPGTLILATSLTNTYSGPTIINNGVLRLRNNTNLGTAPSTFQQNHLQLNGGTLQFGQDQANNGTFGDPDSVYTYDISDGRRGVSFGESGGRLEVGHINPIPTPVSSSSKAVVPIVNVNILNPINAEGVVELAVRNNVNTGAYNTLTLGSSTSRNYYGGGIKTEGGFNGVTNINGENYVNGLFMEGGIVTFSGNNDFDGAIRVLSGQLYLNGANTYKGQANFTEALTIGAATVTLGRDNSLGTAGFKVVMSDQAQLRLMGTNQTLLSLSGTASSTISNGYSRASTSLPNLPSVLTVDLAVNETYAGKLSNGGSSLLSLTKTGDGRLSLTNNTSDFTGNVIIQEGVLDISSINFVSGQSALGLGRTGAASEILINGATLSLSPRGQQVTNRSFTMGAGVNGATIVANGINQAARVILGSDLIIYDPFFGVDRLASDPVGFAGNGSRTLTLSGVNTGDNEFMLQLGDKSKSEVTSLLKTGPGTWVLGMPNSYTGETTVQEGVLALSGNGSAGTAALAVTANKDTDYFTITGQSLPNGIEISFPFFVGTTLPAGIAENTRYYTVNSAGNSFKVATSIGGAAVDITGNGTSVFIVPNIQTVASTVPDFSTGRFTGNLIDGMPVVFSVQIPYFNSATGTTVNGVLPSGINAYQTYYVRDATGTTFRVSTTPSGAAVSFTNNGAGLIYYMSTTTQNLVATAPDFTQDTFSGQLANGTPVLFRGQVLPAGITNSQTYYVVNATSTTFKVATTLGGTAVDFTSNGTGTIYYTPGNTDPGGINVVGGRLELRDVDYMVPETVTFQGGGLSLPTNTTARWAGNFDVQVNSTFTVGQNSELILDGNLLGTRQITQLGEGTIRLRGESIMPSLPDSVTNTLDNSRRAYSLQAGTLILDYSLNNNSKLVDNATLVLGGSRRGGILRLEGGSHEEIVGSLSLSTGANAIYRDSGSSVIRLNSISRAEGATLYFDATQIAKVDLLNVNDILGGWAIIREAPVQAAWVLPGTVSRGVHGDAATDNFYLSGLQPSTYLVDGVPIVFSSSNTLPAPLVVGKTYYATQATSSQFKVSETQWGLPIDLTTDGTPYTTTPPHTFATTGTVRRAGPASLIFKARDDKYPGPKGNNIFKVQIIYSNTPGDITSTLTGPEEPTPADPLTYTIFTTKDKNRAREIVTFFTSDPKGNKYLTLAVSGNDTTVDTGSYGPGLLTSGTNDSGIQALGWAKNGTNAGDGYVQPTTSYEADNWVKNKNTNVTTDTTLADGAITSTLRFATDKATTITLNEDGDPDTVHTLQTGAILVSPTVRANDSSIVGSGSLTTMNNGNLKNFIIHQYNEAGDLVIGVDMVDRKPVKKFGRLTSGNRKIITGISTTADLVVGDSVRFTDNSTNFGPAPNTTTPNTTSAVIARIDPDGHTVELDRETLVNDSRREMTFTLTGGTTVNRFASHQSTTTQNRILGVVGEDGVISTADIYIGMQIAGPGIPPGAIVDFIASDADIRINTNHHFTDIWSEFTLTPSVGLEKLGGGTLVLSGDNSYTGITFLAGGTIRATKLTDGGVVGSLGAATASAGNLNFNGGTLLYVGEDSSSNRGFTVTDFARISVGHEKTTAIFSGDVSGTDRLEKAGPGTLQMSGNASLSEIKIDEGKLLVQAVDRNAAPGSYSQSNLSGGSLGSLRLGGGKFEVRGAAEGNTTLTFGGNFYVDEGASEVRAVSVLGYDPNNLSLGPVSRTTTLNLMGGEETTTVVRSSGGTVLFVEAPEAGAAAANVVLNTSTFERAQILPWAVYQDITNVVNPGVNDFASISLVNGAVVSADSQSLYDLGDFFMNADNWGTVEPGSTIDASEGGRIEVELALGVDATVGVKQLKVAGALATDFAKLTDGMSVFGPGMPAGTRIVALDSNLMIIYLNNAATATTAGGTYLFTKSRTFYGTLTDDRDVNTLRYYSSEDSAITIGAGKTLKLTSGAILVGSNVRGGQKSIVGPGNITGVVESGQGSDLVIHNYNTGSAFTIGANIIDNVILSQLGKGASAKGVGSLFVGVDRMFIVTGAFDFFSEVTPGMEVSGPGLPDGTTVVSKNSVEFSITLSNTATSTQTEKIYTFRSRTSFVQSGTGTTILSGNNTYTGDTFVHGGVLRLNSANAVPGGITASASSSSSSHIIIKEGVLGLGSGNFTRSLGTENNQVEFKGSGGFAAYGQDRTVNFGGNAVSPIKLRYGNDGFVTDGSSLILGALDATHKVTLLNPIDLGSFSQAVRVVNGPADIEGELGGALSGLGTLVKFGSGSLRLSASNTHEGGIEIAEGRLVIADVANALGLGSGPVKLGTSNTNTTKNTVTELAIEGGTVNKEIHVGNVNSRGSEWVARGNTDSTAGFNVGAHASSTLVNGTPAIAYYDTNGRDLKFVRAADGRGTSWLAPVTLASEGDVGQFPSLSIINGFPAVSYYDATNGTLCYIQASDASGVAWKSPVIVEAQPVNAIALQSDGKIIIGGTFLEFDGVTKTRLARLDSTGVLDTTFSATVNGEVRAIAVQSDNNIVIGGDFDQVNGTTRNNIARLLSDGGLDTTYNPNANSPVNTLVLDDSGNMLVGGAFTSIAGVTRNRVARLTPAAGAADSFDPNAGGEVYALAIERPSGTILIGGNYTSLKGSTRRRIARVDSTGALQAFDPNFNETTATVRAIAVASDGSVYLGGLFNTLTGTGLTTSITRNRLVRVTSAGLVDKTFSVELNAEVRGLRMLTSGKLAVWGLFTKSLTSPADYLVCVKTDGKMDTAFAAAPNQGVNEVIEVSGGKLLVGGSFSNLGGVTQHWLARLNADGTGDTGFNRKVNDRGQYTSMMPLATFTGNSGGFPAIAYHDIVNGDLRYVRANDVNGNTWSPSIAISTDTTNNVGVGIVMKTANIGGDVVAVNTSNSQVSISGTANSGTPAIVYSDATTGDLKYTLAYNQDGSFWTKPITIQSGAQAGNHISFELVNGFPAVAYYNGSSLSYVRANDAVGVVSNLRDAGTTVTRTVSTVTFTSTWGSSQVLDSNGNVGQYPSLAIVNGQPTTTTGNPAVSYYDVTNGDLKYVRSTTADGLATGNTQDPPTWGVPATVLSTDNVGQNTTLLMTDGVVGIVYRDVTHNNMEFIHLSDAAAYSKLSFSGDTILDGNLNLDGSALLSASTGRVVTLNGQITGDAGLRLVSEGSLLINSSNNSFGAGLNGEAPVVIRSGHLLLGVENALGTSAVDLGDSAPGVFIRRDASGNVVSSSPQVITVDRATTGSSMIRLAGRFDPLHNGKFGNAGGPGAFVEVNTTIDGRTFSVADVGTLILVKDEEGNPAWNGVYRVEYNSGLQPDGTMNLVRAPEMDELVEFGYGVQVRVSNGTLAGKAYFLASRVTDLNVSPVLWEQDVPNGALSLRANASGMTIANEIRINARDGAGTMSLGATQTVTTGSVVFSGPITLQDNQTNASEVQALNLDSNITSGFGVTVSGLISEEHGVGAPNAPADVLSLVKTGSGVVTLTNGNNSFHGGVTVNQGTLLVMNTSGSATGSGLVTVNAGAALGGTGIIGGSVSLQGTGSDDSGRARLVLGDPTQSTASVETLTIVGGLEVGPNSVVEFTVGRNNFTQLAAQSVNITATGRLIVSLADGATLNTGDSFRLLLASSLTFDQSAGQTLSQYLRLPGQYVWDTSQFLTTGTVLVTGVTQPVSIPGSGNPEPKTVNPFTSVEFKVTVNGSPDFVYQWQKGSGGGNYVNIGGEIASASNSNTLTLTNVTEADEGTYRVIVTNGAGLYPAESTPVQLMVNDLPAIVQQPVSQTVNPDASATFTVVVSGPAPYSFQWRRGIVNIPNDARFEVISNGNTSTLTVKNVTEADDRADYNVIVSNSAGPAPVSQFVALNVNDPVVITIAPSDLTVSNRDPATFTVQHTGTAPFTYQWQRDRGDGAGFVNILNATNATLVLPQVFVADSGQRFRVIVDNMLDPVTSEPATLTVQDGFPSILLDPISTTLLDGETLQLTAKVGGAQTKRKVQWLRNGKAIRAGSSTYAGVTTTIDITETMEDNVTVSTLTVHNITTRFGGAYALAAQNINGKNRTAATAGQVVVVNNPETTLPAQDTKTAAMTVTATGPKGFVIGYQWQRDVGLGLEDIAPDDTRFIGANTRTLKLVGVTTDDSGVYSCIVTGTGPAPDNEVVGGTHYLQVYTEAPELIQPLEFPPAMVGADFEYQIPVDQLESKSPTKFAASGLPSGLKLDPKTGLITGRPKAPRVGGYLVKITVSNGFGSSTADPAPILDVQSVPTGAVGVFAGWIPRHAVLNDGIGGRFDLTTSTAGSFSGRVTLGRAAYAFKGTLILDPNTINPDLPMAEVSIPRKGKTPLTLTFTLDHANNSVSTATLSDDALMEEVSFNGWRYLWSELLNPATYYEGYHTFALSPPDTGEALPADKFPQGDGYAAFTVLPSGRLSLAGKTADGQSITGGQFVGPNGEILIYQTLYTTALRGSLVGQIKLDKMDESYFEDNEISSSPATAPTWTRPENLSPKNRYYQNGFGPLTLTAVGGAYVDATPPLPTPLNPTPAPVNLILGLPDTGTNTNPENATLVFSSLDELAVDVGDPSLPSRNALADPEDDLLPNYLGIITGNKFVLPKTNVAGTKIAANPKTGVFSGSFTIREIDRVHGDKNGFLNRGTKFYGIIVKSPTSSTGMVGAGYFLLPKAPTLEDPNDSLKTTPIISGQVLLSPREETEE